MEDCVANPAQAASAYSETDMRGLEGAEAIRMRPGMYVGGTDIKALHHLVYEVVDNSIDEAMAGRCDYVEIIIHADELVTINDNGVGIPVGINAEKGISTLTAAFTHPALRCQIRQRCVHGVGRFAWHRCQGRQCAI